MDAGLKATKDEAIKRIFHMYDREGIEDQRVFDKMLGEKYGEIDYRILLPAWSWLPSGGKESNMVLYPIRASNVWVRFLKMNLKLGLSSGRAAHVGVGRGSLSLSLVFILRPWSPPTKTLRQKNRTRRRFCRVL